MKKFTALATLLLTITPITQAQNKASARERAGAEVFGLHCSTCHGVRLIKDDAAVDLTTYITGVNEERFVLAAKTARGAMPSFANLLSDKELGGVYAYIKRGHTPDLDDVRMESNH